jgi:cobalt-zinc-cadmium efflux system outer membrane protein
MRVALLLILGVSVCAASPALAQDPPARLTEREALQRLAANDPRLRAVRARIDEVRAAQAERVRWPNPSFSLAREEAGTHDEFLLARQELPVSGRLGRLQEAGQFAVEAAEADARFQTLVLQSEVRDAFTALLLAQEREVVIRSAIAQLQKFVEILRARESGGEGSTYDRMRGQRALVDLEAELGAAAAARARAQGRLAGYLGLPSSAQALVADGSLDVAPAAPAVSTLIEHAQTARADYRALELAAAQHRAEESAADRLRIPTPTLSGGVKRSGNDETTRTGYVFSVDVPVPLFNRGQTAVALARAQTARAEADAMALRVRIDAEIRAAHAALVVQQEHAARYRSATGETIESLLQIARVGYEEGELGILELLDAARLAVDGRLRLLELGAAVRRAAIELDRVVGMEIKP